MFIEMEQVCYEIEVQFGGWGVVDVGNILEGLFDVICIVCVFQDYNMNGVVGVDLIVVFVGVIIIFFGSVLFCGNVVDLLNVVVLEYGFILGDLLVVSLVNNIVKEDILLLYVMVIMDGEIGGFEVNLVVGVCYECIDVMLILLQFVFE